MLPYQYGLFLFSLIFALQAQAQLIEIQQDEAFGKTVADIGIQGLKRTRIDVVQTELLIPKGVKLQAALLLESLKRLKNLRLFHEVKTRFFLDEKERLYIRFYFSEKFTTVPILKLSQGGGSRYLVAGAYDVNTMGQYIESGGQYESWNGEDGGVLWFRNPRFLGQRVRFGADLWSVKRPRNLYLADGTDQGNFVSYQRKLNMFFEKERTKALSLGSGIEFVNTRLLPDTMSNQLSTGVTDALQKETDVTTVWVKAYLKLGQLNYDNKLAQGLSSEINLDYSAPALGSDTDAFRLALDNKWFWRFGNEANLAARFRWAGTNSQRLQDLFYIGGFEHVRGYFDGQLRGRQYWQSNLEYRDTLFENSWFYLQGNLFVDFAQLIHANTGIESNTNDLFYSAGLGFRIGSVKIYRFLGRLDVAIASSHPATSRISFGVQQFF